MIVDALAALGMVLRGSSRESYRLPFPSIPTVIGDRKRCDRPNPISPTHSGALAVLTPIAALVHWRRP